VASAPIAGGVLTISGEGIVAVGTHVGDAQVVDLGDVAILPGLVNAHTHLEFSDVGAPLGQPGEPLPTWIRSVVAQRRARHETAAADAISRGLKESTSAGVTAIGEISTGSWPPVGAVRADVMVFHESIGLAATSASTQADAAARHVASARHEWNQANLLPGLSPHAPYSVHPDLLDRLVQLAIESQVPVAMHVAESREELELLATGQGPFRDMLEAFGVWQEGIFGARRPLDVLEQLAHCPRALVIHGNYLATDEIEMLRQQAEHMSLVYCPRTHAYFRHEAYPLAQLLSAGVHVTLGTDSRASNPDLSLWGEMRHVSAHHLAVRPAQILELGTLCGARALGLAAQLGTLETGKLANLAIVPIAEHAARDPHELLLDSSCGPTQTYWRGQRV
jgi:cytosine/adenosine deaminase-related metal-dependent hydrolase